MTKLGPEARQLIDAGRGALRPSAGDKARVLEALRARLGARPGAVDDAERSDARHDTAPAPQARPSPLGWGRVSALAAGALVVGGVGFHYLSTRSVAAPPTVPTVAPVADTAAPSAPPPATAPLAPSGPPVAADPVAAPPAPPPAEAPASHHASDRLGEEVSILSRAEAELHAGRFTSALRLLDEHQRKFPNGKLAEERNAAKQQALDGIAASKQ